MALLGFQRQGGDGPGVETLQPDRLSLFYPMYMTSRRPQRIETVDQQYVLSDGTRTLEMHPVAGLQHAQGLLVAYLPKEKILVNADLYSPPAAGAAPPAPTAAMRSLAATIQRLKLDVAQHAPIHGRLGTGDEFRKIVTAAPSTP